MTTDEYEKRIYDLSQLLEISRSLNSTLDINILLDSLLYTIMGQLRVINIGIFLKSFFDNSVYRLQRNYKGFEFLHGANPEIDADSPVLRKFSEKAKCYTLGELAVDFPNDPCITVLQEILPSLIIPMVSRSGLVGFIIVGEGVDGEIFSDDQQHFVLDIALFAAIAINNSVLFEMASTDMMTKLKLRHYFLTMLDNTFTDAIQHDKMFAVIMIDIDHFKKLNDTYGHQFGDYVLKQIASIIKSHSREVDICGRYGGEEFLVIANLNETNAVQFARKLHDAIETETFEHPSAVVKVTVSIGIAECNNEVKTKQELIERADRAMYKAKRDGRNLVRVWKDVQADAVLSEQNGVEELRGKFQELSLQMQGMYVEAIGALVKAVEAREPDAVYHHSENVARYAVEIARRMKLPDDQIEVIKFGALLHDIGKISIPDSILMKNGPLPAEEQLILNRHPEVGVSILKDIRFLEKEITVVLYHHERYDGSGFPHGLCKHEIPVGARIVAVADAYDRMLHGRGGSDRKTEDEACTLLKENREKLFSPEVVDAFLETI